MPLLLRALTAVAVVATVLVIPVAGHAGDPVSPLAVDPIPGRAWIANGEVRALVRDGGTAYLGGDFDFVGPNTGGVAWTDASTGAATEGLPYVEGAVMAAVPDGSGGFYVGGTVTAFGGVRVHGLARLHADGSLDLGFRPEVALPSSARPGLEWEVHDLLELDGTLYVAGAFTSIDGQPRQHLAAFDLATGALLPWSPQTDGLAVTQMAAIGSTIYLAGDFATVDGQARDRLAAVTADTGQLTDFHPRPIGGVRALAASANALYVGGRFTLDLGERRNLVALDPATGDLLPWNPVAVATDTVEALAVDGSRVFAGTGEAVRAIPISDGSRTAWSRWAGGNPVWELALHGGRLYAGGPFKVLDGKVRSGVAALDPLTGTVLGWNPGASGGVQAFGFVPGQVFLGGGFESAGGVARENLAAIDLATGRARAWNPGADQPVQSLAVAGATVYAGGWFDEVGGQERHGLAAVDATTGVVRPWRADTDDVVNDIVVDGPTVYVGGSFETIDGLSRSRLAALTSTSGELTPWWPEADGDVAALALGDDEVYVGGLFDTVSGKPRSRLAAIGTDGAVRAWAPAVAGGAALTPDNLGGKAVVRSLAVTADTVYVGGDFDTVAGQAREGLAALSPASGAPRAWSGRVDGSVNALAVSGGLLYAGGEFRTRALRSRADLAAFATATGAEQDWTPLRFGAGINDIAVSGSSVVVAAYSFYIGTPLLRDAVRRFGLAVLDSKLPTVWGTPGVDGNAVAGAIVTCQPGTGWSGAPTSFAYQWLRDDVPLLGATGATYRVVQADVGEVIRCRVSATNFAGTTTVLGVGTRASAAPVVVEPKPLSLTLRGVIKTSTRVTVRFTTNRRVRVRLYVDPPGPRGRVQVNTRLVDAGSRAIAWNRMLGSRRAPTGGPYRLVVTVTSGSATVAKAVYVRL